MKVKEDFKTLNETMQKQQKETDEEQDKQMKTIEEKVKAIQSKLDESTSMDENAAKLGVMQAEMATMQEKFQTKMIQIEVEKHCFYYFFHDFHWQNSRQIPKGQNLTQHLPIAQHHLTNFFH